LISASKYGVYLSFLRFQVWKEISFLPPSSPAVPLPQAATDTSIAPAPAMARIFFIENMMFPFPFDSFFIPPYCGRRNLIVVLQHSHPSR